MWFTLHWEGLCSIKDSNTTSQLFVSAHNCFRIYAKKRQFSALLDCAVEQAVGSAWSSQSFHPSWPALCRFGSGATASCSSPLSALRKHQNGTWHISAATTDFDQISFLFAPGAHTQAHPTRDTLLVPSPGTQWYSQGQCDLKLLNKVSPLCLVFSLAIRLPYHRECN